MKLLILLIAFSLSGIFGCREKAQDRTRQTTAADSTESLIDDPISSSGLAGNAEVVNSFGMKFVRIGIDPKVDVQSDPPFPTETYQVFACMSGYEQRCIQVLRDESKPNAYGLIDMLDGDVECLGEVGVLMGLWTENWPGIYDGYEKPSCASKWWTICNPDADDDLNEIIVARFVLVPENGVPPETP